jgi:hypothetical protein
VKARLARWLRSLDPAGWGYRLGSRVDDFADRIDPSEPVEWTQMGWLDEAHGWGGFGSIFMAPLADPPKFEMPDLAKAFEGLQFKPPVVPDIAMRKDAIQRLVEELDIEALPWQRRFIGGIPPGGEIGLLRGTRIIEIEDDKTCGHPTDWPEVPCGLFPGHPGGCHP